MCKCILTIYYNFLNLSQTPNIEVFGGRGLFIKCEAKLLGLLLSDDGIDIDIDIDIYIDYLIRFDCFALVGNEIFKLCLCFHFRACLLLLYLHTIIYTNF